MLSISGSPSALGKGDTLRATPTVTAGAYLAGDCVGGMLTLANAALVPGGGGVVKNFSLADKAGQDAEIELWLFSNTFTSPGDNNPWVLANADVGKFIGVITTSNGAYFAAGTPSIATVEASQRYDLVGTDLYVQLVTRGTPTYVSTSDISISVGVLQD